MVGILQKGMNKGNCGSLGATKATVYVVDTFQRIQTSFSGQSEIELETNRKNINFKNS